MAAGAQGEASQGRPRRAPPLDALPHAAVQASGQDLRQVSHPLQRNGIVPVLSTCATLDGEGNVERYRLQVAYPGTWDMTLSQLGLVRVAQTMIGVIQRVADEGQMARAEAAAVVPRGSQYFADWAHCTGAGAEAVAKCAADSLARARLVDAEVAP